MGANGQIHQVDSGRKDEHAQDQVGCQKVTARPFASIMTTFSLVKKMSTVRIMMTFTFVEKTSATRTLVSCDANFNWRLELDVKNVFWRGNFQEKEYMEIPPDFDTRQMSRKVCKLNKSLYWLKQALGASLTDSGVQSVACSIDNALKITPSSTNTQRQRLLF